MSRQAARTQERIDPAARLVIARYGSQRNAIGSTLFIWVNLGLLLAFGWAAMVVAFDAPAIGVEVLPGDWYAIRLGLVVLGAGLAVMFWRSSQVPTRSMSREAVDGIFQRGVLWSQVMIFLIGVTGVLAAFLLIANPERASKLLAYGVVEVFAVQALFTGYMKTAFNILLDRTRAFLVVTGLFAVFFGFQSMAIAITAINAGQNYGLAFVAGAFLGVVLGSVSLFLRDRSESILPGFLLQLLIFYLFIPFLE